MKVLLVAGARPNFMKVAPLIPALIANGHKPYLVHTGQHYDDLMSAAFFKDLGIPEPDAHLGVGSGSHAEQLSRIMSGVEPQIANQKPDWVVVVGDVNSTLGAALVAARLRPKIGCRIAHVEAGLRSGDWRMPEEINRVLTDRIADLLLTPSHDADENLLREGIAPEKIVSVGNIMIDSLFSQLENARRLDVAKTRKLQKRSYMVVTLHRPTNVDDPEMFATILSGLQLVAEKMPVIFPMHPRSRQRVADAKLDELLNGVIVMDPLPYVEMLSLVDSAGVVLTDSGGLQEETTVLGVPCITLREQTERPITITNGTNRLIDWPPSAEGIRRTVNDAMASRRASAGVPEGWDGNTAERIVAALEKASSASA